MNASPKIYSFKYTMDSRGKERHALDAATNELWLREHGCHTGHVDHDGLKEPCGGADFLGKDALFDEAGGTRRQIDQLLNGEADFFAYPLRRHYARRMAAERCAGCHTDSPTLCCFGCLDAVAVAVRIHHVEVLGITSARLLLSKGCIKCADGRATVAWQSCWGA